MPSTRALLLTAVLLAAGLAGCIGGDDGDTDPEADLAEANATDEANETDDTEPGVERTWTNETFEGQVSGFNAGAVSATNGDNMQTFAAETGIAVLFLNLTTEGGSVQMTIGGPDCDVSGSQVPSCAETVTTSGGEASYENETPSAGEWQVRLSVGDPAGAEVSYTLDAVQGINAVAEP